MFKNNRGPKGEKVNTMARFGSNPHNGFSLMIRKRPNKTKNDYVVTPVTSILNQSHSKTIGHQKGSRLVLWQGLEAIRRTVFDL